MTTEQEPATSPHHQGQPESKHHWVIALVVVIVVLAVIFGGILPRVKARAALKTETDDMAVPTVSVVRPTRTAPAQEVVLPANVQAFVDAPIYARTNGYLKKWYADIGTHVKQGQLLAEIDTPEVNQQLQQAKADLATSEANLHLSQITAERYAGLLKSDSVSKQEADNAEGDYAAKKATVESAEYNVKRLQDLQSFQKIYAPFSGVISARNTDVGALIDSGSSGGSRTEMFHIVSPDKLRVYVNVPEIYSRAAKPGLKAQLILNEYPDHPFEGTLVRTANAIDQSSRTLLVEIDVNNTTGQLLAGSYAEVHLKLPSSGSAFLIPVNTLLFRSEGLRIGVVNNGQVTMMPLTIGRDYGDTVEVVSGLKGDENIIVNPPDSVVSGEKVRVVQKNQPNNAGSGF
ncbi:MAG TPA: efflux RND transporter periplasmic adaptor subunit [Terriglobales bacterium]|jgi:RND family efflux transporter MFP subunit